MYFGSKGSAPAITNRSLLPVKVATRGMKDITGMSAGSHPISPNGDGVGDSATVTYTLPVSSKVTASIWSGSRLVKTYAEASYPAGTRSFTWDGKDSGGAVVGDGTYTAKIDARSNNSAY